MDSLKTIDLFAKPQRDASGKFIKGNTESVGNSGKPCFFCRDKENILKKVELFSLWTRGKLPDKHLHMPYIQDLCDEDYLDILVDTWNDWTREEGDYAEHNAEFHSELIRAKKKLFARTEGMLLKRTLAQNPTGAIFQLKVNHGYIETEKRILAGDQNNPVREKLEIEITQAKKYE